ncbi:M16 family metallopeptidase [Clostridium rectalis]|uniref:M16 family metallopeptidase n=1 Tax=Clostridium rectalis TaxID=2040295 RepID=UPI000F6417E5|nr:pitrilysin family protein [Clostridium rectalis]
MISYELENGIKIIYKKIEDNITSFCIGVKAGAIEEKEFPLGTAHFVEHMVFKGTKKRNESTINALCDEIFGFENAMTNYPYCIYYGTTLTEDFENGLELFSDIILNPVFPEKGFEEEREVILEELKQWSDELSQYCEDQLFLNAFSKRRIKDLIIGNEISINNIKLEDLKSFYEKYYIGNNMVISVVTSMEFEKVKLIVRKYFSQCKVSEKFSVLNENIRYENNIKGIFTSVREDIKGARIQYCFPIHQLNNREVKILSLFNNFFGEGTSSILYDSIRTKNGVAYEIGSSIKNEIGIKVFSITLGTSKEKIDKALKLIDSCIHDIKNKKEFFTKDKVNKAAKSMKLKRELRHEKSVQMAKDFTCYELMYGNYKLVFEEIDYLFDITHEDINKVINEVLKCPSIQIIK